MKCWLINVKTRVGFELRNRRQTVSKYTPLPWMTNPKFPRNLTGTHVYVKSAIFMSPVSMLTGRGCIYIVR